jgi:iron complex transport system substrate-binding protein
MQDREIFLCPPGNRKICSKPDLFMKKRIKEFSVFLVLMLLPLAGCDFQKDNGKETGREITDMYGRKVMIPEKVNSIVGVGPGALRLLIYMDLVDLVSGVEDVEFRPGRPYTFAHPKLTKKTVVGPFMGGDSELLTINNPDVIFMAFMSVSDADELQNRTGIPVVGLNSGNLRNARDTLFEAFNLIGEITERKERADSLKNFLEREINELNRQTAKLRRTVSAYVGGVSYRGSHGIASTQAWFSPFDFVNITNVAEVLDEEEPVNPVGTYVDVEQIIAWNPDFLFLDAAGLEQIKPTIAQGTPLRNTIGAFSNANVYTLMPHNWYATNIENVLINSWFVGKVAYPDAFEDVEFEKKAREIYKYMVGNDVYDQMKDTYDGWEEL